MVVKGGYGLGMAFACECVCICVCICVWSSRGQISEPRHTHYHFTCSLDAVVKLDGEQEGEKEEAKGGGAPRTLVIKERLHRQ